MSEPWISRVIALLLFVLASGLVVSSQRGQGIARDEVVYMNYGSRYADWWVDFATGSADVSSDKAITKVFGGVRPTDGNREHPPLMKTLFGFSERLFHDRLSWMSEISGYRLPTAIVHAVLVVLVFFFTLRFWGRSAGLCSALLVLFLPRAFFHAGLATFDSPVVTFWFATITAYTRTLKEQKGYLLVGLCAGLTLATKHNALMLPALIFPHFLYLVWSERRSGGGLRGLWTSFRALGGLKLMLAIFLVAPIVLIALWPWMWFDTKIHLREWIAFHLHHVHYNFEYLGRNWNAPPFPWHVALVTTALTIPLATGCSALVGLAMAGARARRGERGQCGECPALLLFLSAGVAMGPFFLRTTPIFGAEKHWAAAAPSLCIFAGLGVVWLARGITDSLEHARPRWNRGFVRRVPLTVLLATVVGAAAVETFHAQPYALSHYNALAGGPRGGASLGMNRQFWGYAARGVLRFVNSFAREGKAILVYTHDASPAWGLYRAAGLRDSGLPDAGHEGAGISKSQIAFVVHEKHFIRHDFMIWRAYNKVQPSFVLTYDGVPLVSVYVRDELLATSSP